MATFYESVSGVTHGMSYYEPGAVFAGDESLDAAFDSTEGKVDGEVQYKKSDKKSYDAFMADRNHDLVDGSPRNIVGFEPTGEDALTSSQVGADDKPVEADKQAGKPEEGDPLAPDSAEAERRLGLNVKAAAGVQGGAGPAASTTK